MNKRRNLENALKSLKYEADDIVNFECRSQMAQFIEGENGMVKEIVELGRGWFSGEEGSYQTLLNSCDILPTGIYSLNENSRGDIIFKQNNFPSDDYIELPDVATETIVKDIETFWGAKNLYTEIGYTHKRGILLYGMPGGGKTTTIRRVIMNVLNNNGIVINVNQKIYLLDKAIKSLRQIEKDRPLLIVLEDLEILVSDSYDEKILLSILEGENQTDNIVFLATTNYPENLSDRFLKRPGRFDFVIHIGAPSADNRLKYITETLKRINKHESPDINLKTWVKDTEGLGIPHLKELITSVVIMNMDYESSLKKVKEIKSKKKSSNDDIQATMGFGLKK